ncbi:hypothetical protein Pla52n_51000 [Stieleria varia]|uniref:Uncharacterized protein n=1 Tax=Stieleria varia TaxID=2528005 RepID=A0A5C6AF41_9BACT|nr:hypothetical protein Pla52n_51000 [Stieleria varia]
MRVWEWQSENLPVWVGYGDPEDHWNRRFSFDNRLTAWLRMFEEMPPVCNRFLPAGSMPISIVRSLARLRVRQIATWCGEHPMWLLNADPRCRTDQPCVRIDRGKVKRYRRIEDLAFSMGRSAPAVLDDLWRGKKGLFIDDLR